MAGRGALVVAPGTPGTGAGRRRGGGGAPTTDPRTVTNFEDITSIPFVFARHPMYPEAHTHINNIYSDAFLDMADLFAVKDPPTRVTFIADPVAIVKAKIQDDSIIPNAIDTPDATPITPLWARCSFTIFAGNQYTNRRLTPATLKEAMQYAIAYDMMNELRITIGIQALHFGPGLSYLQWGTDIRDSTPGFATPAAPVIPAAAVPAPAPGPAPPSSADIVTEVAHAVTTAIAGTPPPTVTVTTLPAPSTTRLRTLFNPSSLPADIRARFKHKQDRKILTAVIYTPSTCPRDPCHDMHSWIDPPMEKTMCADGTIFFHIPIDEKMVMKNPVPCKKDTYASICRWY